jgi:hypothetical protein
MAFKMKKPIWHGTDSHKQAVKSGAPSTSVPIANWGDITNQGDDIEVKPGDDPNATVEGTSKLTTEGPKGGSAIDKATNEKVNKTKTENTDEPEDKYNEDGSKKEGKKWHEKKAWRESGIGSIVEAAKSIGRGIKNIRTKNKAKKAKSLADAKAAVGSGSETLKQAKLVERNRKKTDRKAKSDIKKAKRDKKKLAKYRKKNPVRGKEAVDLVTGGGNKSLV